uniref:HMG box domain-containing protein n=1 Tax=viral metagenome TaxID=1070528 RepID=A0A6C0KAC4_9ZZZZ
MDKYDKLLDENAELRTMVDGLNEKMDTMIKMLKANHRQELRRVKKNRPADAPKRHVSSYIHYSNIVRAAIKEENPDADMKDMSKLIGSSWRALGDQEKKKYNDIAADDKNRYNVEMDAYDKAQGEV